MFECKNCGGDVEYDIKSGNLVCKYCGSSFSPYDYENKTSDAQENKEFEVTVFTCPQCGGEIFSTDNTAAGFCSFCGASTVLYSRIKKERRPSYIIPFSKTKEDCKQAYKNFANRFFYAPKAFKNPDCIDEFRGIYMPFWTYNVVQKGSICIDAEKSHRDPQNAEYVITIECKLQGKIDAEYKGMMYDASSSFGDDISEKMMPYYMSGSREFSPAFLSGFYADIADVPSTVYEDEVKWTAFENTIKDIPCMPEYYGYDLVDIWKQTPDLFGTSIDDIEYSLFPVWFLSYRNDDRVIYAAVNGQTGKVVADIPVSIGKFLLGSLLLAIPIFIVFCFFTVLTPGWTLTLTGALAMTAGFIFSSELSKISVKESKKNIKKEHIMSIFEKGGKCVVYFVIAANVLGYLYNTIGYRLVDAINNDLSEISNIDGSRTLWTMSVAAAFIISLSSIKDYGRIPRFRGIAGYVLYIISLGLATAVIYWQPVSDYWYYAVVFLVEAAVLFMMINVIRAYNILATRKLPQFETHMGGDDRA